MLTLALRFGVLAAGLLVSWMAVFSWRTNDPPTWTIFMPAHQAIVTDVAIREGRVNGSLRHWPEIEVEWPAGSEQRVSLGGLKPSFYGGRKSEAEEIVADFVVGEAASIREYEGRLYAARVDLFHTAHAVFLTLFALLLTLSGAFLAWALRDRPAR